MCVWDGGLVKSVISSIMTCCACCVFVVLVRIHNNLGSQYFWFSKLVYETCSQHYALNIQLVLLYISLEKKGILEIFCCLLHIGVENAVATIARVNNIERVSNAVWPHTNTVCEVTWQAREKFYVMWCSACLWAWESLGRVFYTIERSQRAALFCRLAAAVIEI